MKISLKQIKTALAKNGELRVQWLEGEARFELGDVAAKWANAINNPKSLLDKLGVKPDHIVCVIGIDNNAFLADLNRRVPNVTSGKPTKDSDLVFFQADQPKQLEQLKKLAKSIQPAGAIWVITPKKSRRSPILSSWPQAKTLAWSTSKSRASPRATAR